MSSISSVVVEDHAGAQGPLVSVGADSRAPLLRTRLLALILVFLALLPVVGMLNHATSLNRDIPYWDEIDSVLALLLRLEAGVTVKDFVGQMLAVTNEHRTVTSRVLFALSYAFTGTVNFVWIGLIGNLFILVASGLLVMCVRKSARRIRLGVVLAFMVYHLGNYENFLWSGSSIDHFQIITLAAACVLGLRHGSRNATGLAAIAAILATFTLAHGLVLWPVGLLFLARDRRWPAFAAWSAIGLAATLIYFAGFHFNPHHRIGASGVVSLQAMFPYFLQVLGSPLAFGHVLLAQWLGAALVVVTLARTLRSDWLRERDLLPMLWFVIGSAALIAIGRAELPGGKLFSRYFILGGIGWAILIFSVVDRCSSARRPFLAVFCVLPFLVGFNLAQNSHYGPDASTFVENRDRAALRYRQHGEDGRGPLTLHPLPHRATEVLALAEQRGVYRMPPLCERREFPDAEPTGRISYYLDEFTLNSEAAYFAGWVAAPNTKLRRDQIHLVLKSATSFLVFSTVQIRRPDVVQAHDNPDWELSGFRAVIRRSRLQPGDYQVGFLLAGNSTEEFIMTDHWLHLTGPGSVTFKQ